MFASLSGLAGFGVGVALTLGLLLSPHLVPGGWGYRLGLTWPWPRTAAVLVAGLGLLALTLWAAGRLLGQARSWKEPRALAAAALIAVVANTLYMFLVEWFALGSGWRALIAVLGVPVIYGNLVRVLGRVTLAQAVRSILTGALATMGAGFILAALVRGW